MADSALVGAQIAGGDGDEALYAGQWEIALDKYNLAATLCREAIPVADAKTQDMLQKLVTRYTEKAQQIQDYIESPKSIVVSNEVSEGSVDNLSVAVQTELSMQDGNSYFPFGLYQEYEERTTEARNFEVSSLQSGPNLLWAAFWQHLEKLIGMLPSPRQMQAYFEPKPTELSDPLDTSFIVVPGNSDSSNFPSRVRINLNNDDTEITTNTQKSDMAQLNAELERLKNTNRILLQQNTKLRKMCNVSAGMQGLLHENTMLKKSISNFRHQVQKQTEQWHSMMVARSQETTTRLPMPTMSMAMPPGHQPRPTVPKPITIPGLGLPLEIEAHLQNNKGLEGYQNVDNFDNNLSRRINDLEATTNILYKRLEEKEQEVLELNKYKKRYEKIIQSARKKKENQTPEFYGSTSVSDIMDSPLQ